jgi:hypothetical protein
VGFNVKVLLSKRLNRTILIVVKIIFVKCRRQTIRFVLNDRYCKLIKKNIRGDQEGLFELAIQLRTFFCSAICNIATGYGLFDRYLT